MLSNTEKLLQDLLVAPVRYLRCLTLSSQPPSSTDVSSLPLTAGQEPGRGGAWEEDLAKPLPLPTHFSTLPPQSTWLLLLRSVSSCVGGAASLLHDMPGSRGDNAVLDLALPVPHRVLGTDSVDGTGGLVGGMRQVDSFI